MGVVWPRNRPFVFMIVMSLTQYLQNNSYMYNHICQTKNDIQYMIHIHSSDIHPKTTKRLSICAGILCLAWQMSVCIGGVSWIFRFLGMYLLKQLTFFHIIDCCANARGRFGLGNQQIEFTKCSILTYQCLCLLFRLCPHQMVCSV